VQYVHPIGRIGDINVATTGEDLTAPEDLINVDAEASIEELRSGNNMSTPS
jgi:hypothetical protein